MAYENDAETEAAAVIAVTREAGAGELRPLDPKATRLLSVAVPGGYTRETIDLAEYLDEPQRMTGVVKLQTVADLAKYVQRHDDTDATTVWVDMDAEAITAVIDDHTVDGDRLAAPGWGEHRARLDLKPTDAWRHWTRHDGQLLDQEAFAEHVEEGQLEIVKPEAGQLLDIVTTMQGATNAEWRNAIRLSDGQVQLTYSEEATATAGGNGDVEIPLTFELAIAPFLGEDPEPLTARLRYRVKGGKLAIGYKLNRPGDVIRDSIDAIATRLAQTFGDARTFIGTPRQ